MQKQSFAAIFTEESVRSGWKEQRDPQAVLRALGDTMESTRVRAAGTCFGSQLRTDACNALFRAAAVGVETAAAAAMGVRMEGGAQDQRKAEEKAEIKAEKKADEHKTSVTADFLQPLLIGAGFILSALTISISLKRPLSLLSPITALVLGVALVRETAWMKETGAMAQLVRVLIKKRGFADKVIKLLRLEGAQAKEEAPAKEAPVKEAPVNEASANEASAKEASAKEAPAQARRVFDLAQIEKIEALCIRQMELIEQNLPQEQPEPEQPDAERVLWPLVRTMLQKKYADETAFPAEVEDELSRYFRANGMNVYPYSEEHAALFKTQPMDETFTIFPAVVGQDGRIIEYGQACVKEG